MKHALSVPIERMTGYHGQIERFAKRITGENPAKERFGYAYQTAAALLDLRRIREARFKLLRNPTARVKEPPIGKVIWAIKRIGAIAKGKASEEDEAEVDYVLSHFSGHKPGGGAYSLEEGFAVLAPNLE